MNIAHDATWFAGKRVTVMGLGRFGGGLAATKFLVRHAASVTVTDLKSEQELADSIEQFGDHPPAVMRLGRHDEKDFHDTDLIVASPAVRRDHPLLTAARAAGVPVTSEICLFLQFNRGRVIGITGSNGKSTTTKLLHDILSAAGYRTWLGGNIGTSLLGHVDHIRADDLIVLELSSFQLFDLDAMRLSPELAVVTNFCPNHMDWHDTVEQYRRAKQAILRWQNPSDAAVLNANDPDVCRWPHNGQVRYFQTHDTGEFGIVVSPDAIIFRDPTGEDGLLMPQLRDLPGEHNLQNVAAAACAAWNLGVQPQTICRAIEEFEPLPHRLQRVGIVRGRAFVNDSVATTPESVIAALRSFSAPVVLIAGGSDKGVDLTAMATEIVERATAVVLIGSTAPRLDRLLEQAGMPGDGCRFVATSFDAAFCRAVDVACAGDIVLLSPGCASYDWFASFEQRGDRFVRLVEQLDHTASET